MIKTIRVDTIEQLWPLFKEEEYQDNIKRYRSSYIYRGMPNASYKMVPSIRRNCKDKARILEASILKNFTKYASLNDPTISKSIWRQMMAGQHHGLPTRLLDFSHSPLIALQFAAVSNPERMEESDCVVWRIDMAELHELLPHKYKSQIANSQTKIFSMTTLEETVDSVAQYDEDMGDHAMLIVEPSSFDERIVNQFSFFGIVPSEMEDVEAFLDKYTNNTVKYVINKDLRWRIADTLDAFNISERIIYPGLDGLSAWIKRHYYVRDEE